MGYQAICIEVDAAYLAQDDNRLFTAVRALAMHRMGNDDWAQEAATEAWLSKRRFKDGSFARFANKIINDEWADRWRSAEAAPEFVNIDATDAKDASVDTAKDIISASTKREWRDEQRWNCDTPENVARLAFIYAYLEQTQNVLDGRAEAHLRDRMDGHTSAHTQESTEVSSDALRKSRERFHGNVREAYRKALITAREERLMARIEQLERDNNRRFDNWVLRNPNADPVMTETVIARKAGEMSDRLGTLPVVVMDAEEFDRISRGDGIAYVA